MNIYRNNYYFICNSREITLLIVYVIKIFISLILHSSESTEATLMLITPNDTQSRN